MSAWQPLTMSRGAWESIRDQVIEPVSGGTAGDLEGLREAWRPDRAQVGPDQVTVWVTPELATVLAELLDARPELRAAL